jgi:hypothetical protein
VCVLVSVGGCVCLCVCECVCVCVLVSVGGCVWVWWVCGGCFYESGTNVMMALTSWWH